MFRLKSRKQTQCNVIDHSVTFLFHVAPDQSPELSFVFRVGAQAERRLETHSFRVNETAFKNQTTLNPSRETDALKTVLKTLFKGDKSRRVPIKVSNHSEDQQGTVEMKCRLDTPPSIEWS